MYYQQDWLMRQIQGLVAVLARVLFHKDAISYQIEDQAHETVTDSLYRDMDRMLREKKICDAENLLFASLDPTDRNRLVLALDFYQKANEWTDEELEKHNFSRQEIDSGLHRVLELYGVSIPGY